MILARSIGSLTLLPPRHSRCVLRGSIQTVNSHAKIEIQMRRRQWQKQWQRRGGTLQTDTCQFWVESFEKGRRKVGDAIRCGKNVGETGTYQWNPVEWQLLLMGFCNKDTIAGSEKECVRGSSRARVSRGAAHTRCVAPKFHLRRETQQNSDRQEG